MGTGRAPAARSHARRPGTGTPAPSASPPEHPRPAPCRSTRLLWLLKPRQSRSPAGLHFRVQDCHYRKKKTTAFAHSSVHRFSPTAARIPPPRAAGRHVAAEHPAAALPRCGGAQAQHRQTEPGTGCPGNTQPWPGTVCARQGRAGRPQRPSLTADPLHRPAVYPPCRATRRLLQLIGVKFH